MSELLRTNDIRFADWASGLTAEEWAASSLCHTWTNHDVLAHLVIGYSGRASALAADTLRDRTSFDGANAELARRLAASRGPQELLDDFVRYRDRPKGMGRYFPRRLLLGDHVTHELDICFALGRRPTIAPCALTAVLDTQVSLPNPFVPAFRNSRGLRLAATDVPWSHGAGSEVRGTAAELVAALGNRQAVLGRLAGDGVAVLAARVIATNPNRTAG